MNKTAFVISCFFLLCLVDKICIPISLNILHYFENFLRDMFVFLMDVMMIFVKTDTDLVDLGVYD